MKKLIYTITLFVITLFVCNQCKNPSSQEPDKKIEQAVLDFYDYKNGTYWVYQDTFGNIDSTWVSEYTNSQACEGPEKNAICVQNIRYYISSNRTTDRIRADIYPSFTENSTGCGWYMENSVGTGLGWGWNLTYEDNTFSSSRNIVERFETYTVNGEVFNDAYKMKTSIYDDADLLIIAKNKGIITKGSVKFPSKLIRYNIVR
jgi:hypothetical protein